MAKSKVKEKKTRADKVQKHKGGKEKGRKPVNPNKIPVEPLPIRIHLGPSSKSRSPELTPNDTNQKKIFVYENFGEVDEAGRTQIEKRIKKHFLKQKNENPDKAKDVANILQSYGIVDLESEKNEMNQSPTKEFSSIVDSKAEEKGTDHGTEYTKEFPSIDEGVVQESKVKSRKKAKQDLLRKDRGAETAAKIKAKLEKKAAKALKSKDESDANMEPVAHGLTPPKAIQTLTIVTALALDKDRKDEVPFQENNQALIIPGKKDAKRLRRLDKVKIRENKTVANVRPKSLEKLTGLLNKRDGKYSGAKFAVLLDLAEKILIVEAIPGGTIEQKANKIRKDIQDMETEIEPQKLEAEVDKAIILREESPDYSQKALVPREETPKNSQKDGEPHQSEGESALKDISTDTLVALPAEKTVSCQWNQCAKKFSTPMTLFFHVSDDHIGRKKDKLTLKCGWNCCKANTTEFNTRASILSHLKDAHIPIKEQNCCDFCPWTCNETSALKKHMKKSHPDQLTSIPEDPVKSAGVQKRKCSQDDGSGEEDIQKKPPKKLKLGTDAQTSLGESINLKQKKRKHEEETLAGSEAGLDQRPMKKMKKSRKH